MSLKWVVWVGLTALVLLSLPSNPADIDDLSGVTWLTPFHRYRIQHCTHGYIRKSKCYNGPLNVFEWLIFPLSVSEFISEYWEQKPIHIPRASLFDALAPDYATDDTPLAEQMPHFSPYYNPFMQHLYGNVHNSIDIESPIDSSLMQIEVSTSDKPGIVRPFRMDEMPQFTAQLSEEEKSDLAKYKSSHKKLNQWDRAALSHLLRSNFTTTYHHVEKHSQSGFALVNSLMGQTGHIPYLNVIASPNNGKGENAHFHAFDSFVMQLGGIKRWTIYENVSEMFDFMYSINAFNARFDTISIPMPYVIAEWNYTHLNTIRPYLTKQTQFTLYPGDMLYIPRGFLHESDCFGVPFGGSLHVTMHVLSELNIDYTSHFLVYFITNNPQLLTDYFFLRIDNQNISNTKAIIDAFTLNLHSFATQQTIQSNNINYRKAVPYFYHLSNKQSRRCQICSENFAQLNNATLDLITDFLPIFLDWLLNSESPKKHNLLLKSQFEMDTLRAKNTIVDRFWNTLNGDKHINGTHKALKRYYKKLITDFFVTRTKYRSVSSIAAKK